MVMPEEQILLQGNGRRKTISLVISSLLNGISMVYGQEYSATNKCLMRVSQILCLPFLVALARPI